MSQPFFPPILTGSSTCEYAQPYPRATLKPSQFTLIVRVSSLNRAKTGGFGSNTGIQPLRGRYQRALTASARFIALEVGVGEVGAFKAREHPFKAITVIGYLKVN